MSSTPNTHEKPDERHCPRNGTSPRVRRPRSIDASIVIPAYGKTPHLAELLRAIAEGSCRPAEVIVSHSGSDDPTELLRKTCPDAKVLHSDGRLFAGAARNRGAELARSEILVFCDSDVRPAPDWLANLGKALNEDRRRFVVGSVGVARKGGYWGMSTWLCEFSEQAPWRRSGEQAGGASCNMAVRKADFVNAGRFDESMTPGEDTVLFYRLRQAGLQQWFAPEAAVGHFNIAGFRAFFRHQFHLGSNFAKVRRALPMKGALALRFPPLVLGLWVPKVVLVVRRTLAEGASGWGRATMHLPAIVLGSWIFTVGCLFDIAENFRRSAERR